MPSVAFQLIRFGLVGAIATLVHVAMFLSFQHFGYSALLSNSAAFVIAFLISYAGHSHWTFADQGREKGRETQRALRFAGVTVFGFVLNSIIAVVIVDVLAAPPALAALLMLLVTPGIVFLLMKVWTFAPVETR